MAKSETMNAYTILIVDDQRDVRRVLVSGLQTLEYKLEVVEVPSAEEAMLIMPRRKFDLVVTDVRLAGMSGLDLVARLRRLNSDLKIILMTGAEDRQTRRQVEAAGAFAFFYKPIEMADFLDAVERALGLVAVTFTPPPLALDKLADTKPQAAPASPVVKPVVAKPVEPAAPSAPPPLPALATLQQQLKASAALLVTEDGKVLSQAGEFADAAPGSPVIKGLLGVMSANRQLSESLARPTPAYGLFLDGIDYHLALAPVGKGGLLLAVGAQSFQDNLAQAGALLKTAASDLIQYVLGPAPEPVPAAAPEAPAAPELGAETAVAEAVAAVEADVDLLAALASVEVSETEMAAFDDLFSTVEKVKPTGAANLDDFWDTVAEETGSLNLSDSHISFDEAAGLGLAPDAKS